MKNIRRKLCVFLLLSLITSLLVSCAEEEKKDLREHVLMTDVFGEEFYADDTLNVPEISATLYSLAGEPDFLTDEYIAFYDRLWADPYDAPSRAELDNLGYDVSIEWASTHGILLTYGINEGGPFFEYRNHYKWSEFIDTGDNFVIDYKDTRDFTRGDALTALYFCAEEMELDIFVKEDISKYEDSSTLDESEVGIYGSGYSSDINRWDDREDRHDLKFVKKSNLWSWAEACGMIVWDEDGKINQNELITRGEFAAMVEAFKEHYGV